MAGGVSLRKKAAGKRSNHFKPQQQQQQQPTMHTSSNSPFRTRKTLILVSVLSAVAVIVLSWNTWSSFRSDAVVSAQIYSIEVVNEFPHDPTAFTQGLLYGGNDTLLESTGLNGRSSVREVDLQTGKIKILQNMEYEYFGEGLTLLGKRLYQVTWLRNTGFIYDRYNLTKLKSFTHGMKDGWGLATDGKILFGSDGSSSLYHLNPRTMKAMKEHVVKYKGHEVHNLNELEYINNEVWANIWQSDCIARISPVDGSVIGWVLLPELRAELLSAGHNIDVLNGIAWDEDKKRLFVTGKLWPKLYEIKLQPLRKPLQAPVERLCLTPPAHF
ncbi:putative glutaminyl-peptide cyclotransferase transcription factor WD40-like family [Helianthus annuus]|nr:putative glutaminyl-peptide cyclotransferase transcription factor WD40-like family [Helianthus annuus]